RRAGRRRVRTPRPAGRPAHRSRAAARAGVGEHAGGGARDGLSDERGPGEAARFRIVSEHARTNAGRCDREVPRFARRGRSGRRHPVTLRRGLLTAGFTVVAAMLGWLMFVGLPRWYGPAAPAATSPTPSASAVDPAKPARKIKARLFYVDADGLRLTPV